jgi:peptidoglycan/LPS O-acetylase OafA/YrhL
MSSRTDLPPAASSPAPTRSAGRDLIGRGLMWLAAVAAAASAVSAVATVVSASDSTKVVESWRMYGFAVFAGLFVLLALRPRDYRGLWELVILNKAALTLTGLFLLRSATGAGTVVVWDGALTVVLVVAYICCRGWTARPRLWRTTA